MFPFFGYGYGNGCGYGRQQQLVGTLVTALLVSQVVGRGGFGGGNCGCGNRNCGCNGGCGLDRIDRC